MTDDPIRRLREELRALDRAYSPGHHGLWSAARRSDLYDTALAALFDESGFGSGVALAAVGGYGRRRQIPRSDLDLLVVHDGSAPEDLAAAVDRLLYPLWDAGFEVGQAVRTPAECVALATERLDVATALLDVRVLAGERALADSTADQVREALRADVPAFVRRLDDAARTREERFGSSAHLLEPALKDGAGGLRDIESVGWIEALILPEGPPVVRPRERESLGAAEEFLTRVRSAVHLETGKRGDRLPLELQPTIARAMGFVDEPRLIAEDGLMRAIFEHARDVVRVRADVTARIVDPPAVTAGIELDGAASTLDALAEVAERGDDVPPALSEAVERADIADPVEWSPAVLEGFCRLLRAGSHGMEALDVLDRAGVLGRLLPAWTDVRCRPQRDPYHRFTVDAHLTGAVASMASILAAPDPDDPIERDAVGLADDHDALLLGALLHDIGKVGEGGHVPVGARIAGETLDAMGVTSPTRDLVAFMVAEHLLLPDTATRRDLTDEDLIMSVAATIASPERLAALYLLARADAEATGPAAWTPWRRALVRELVVKVQRVFDRGDMGVELAERLTERIGRIRDLLEDEPEAEVERFVLRMPRGYFLAVEPARAAAHHATIAPDIGRNEVRSTATPGPREGTYELLVVAGDRPGLLSWIAGAMSVAGLSILSAQVFTTEDGVAVDLFEVEGAYEAEVAERRWREFRRLLRGVIEGAVSLDHRVRDKRAAYPPHRTDLAVTVRIDNRASDFSTVIEVGAADRIGLLYDITAALADLRLDVHVAKVTTYTERVIDAFYVRDATGAKIADAAQTAEIEAAVRARLETVGSTP